MTTTLTPIAEQASETIGIRIARGMRQAREAAAFAAIGDVRPAAARLALATDSLSSAIALLATHDIGDDHDYGFSLLTAAIAEAAAAMAATCAVG